MSKHTHRAVAKKSKPAHGGRRVGAGRPPGTKERCACGKHTLARAVRLRLRCRRAGD